MVQIASLLFKKLFPVSLFFTNSTKKSYFRIHHWLNWNSVTFAKQNVMKQKVIISLLAVLLVASIIFWNRKVSRSKHEINISKTEIDSLKKNLTTTKYNYGIALAKAHCMTCHGFNFGTDNYLEGVVQRVGEKYLSIYLTKQDSLINAHDPYAISLKNKWGNLGNSHNFKFSQSDLEALMEIMKQ